MRGGTLAFKKCIAIISCNSEASLGARARVQVSRVPKRVAFCVCVAQLRSGETTIKIHVLFFEGEGCTWAKRGRFVIFLVLCLLAFGDTALKS